jgi:predicted GH43/DUF377 family glycosyl hydrolase
MKYLVVFLVLISNLATAAGNSLEEKPTSVITDFSKLLRPVPKEAILGEDGFYVWGGSVVKGSDGLYHMFYSRWKSELGFSAWVTHSEIAHAVSGSPTGPFKYKDTSLPPRGKEYWDGLCTHNPTIHSFDGKYYLYYMGNTGDGKAMKSLNWVHRNNQRIGVAVSDSPYGPWMRADEPLIDVSKDKTAWDALAVNNPSVTRMKDGRILMVYKAVARRQPLPFGGPVSHLAAISSNPSGPFEKLGKPIFGVAGSMFPAEDPYIWYNRQDDRYYAIVKDMQGQLTGRGAHSLAFFTSSNGLDWKPGENPFIVNCTIKWSSGENQKVHRLERPQLLIEDGVPTVLYCAMDPGNPKETKTYNIHIPLIQQQRAGREASMDFAKLIPERPDKHFFMMDEYNVWCNGVVKGEDNLYHMFFSRWPKSKGHEAWVTHSEIAHAVSDTLLGPYRFSAVCLPPRGSQFWDGAMTHNPHVIKADGKYYLYYTGNCGSGYWNRAGALVKPSMANPEWWVNRNNQRVGVAVSDSPYGPWRRSDKPLIDVTEGRRTTGVPTVFQRPDGKFSLTYKSVMEKPGYRGGAVRHFLALSDSPTGPFRDYDKPFVTSPKTDFPIDDHVEWFQDGKYYCIAKDHGDMLTDHGIALLLFESANGLDWSLSAHPLVHEFRITFSDGQQMDFDRLEMPKVYLENGCVTALFLAAKPKGKEDSFSIVLPVKTPHFR